MTSHKSNPISVACTADPTWLLVIVLGYSLTGCGGGERRFAISGEVSYDGQSIATGSIGFVPSEAGTGKSAGADIVDGHYKIPRLEGPLEGSYIVRIHAERPTGRKLQADEGSTETIDEMVSYIPWEYSEGSRLTVDISADRDDLDFPLDKPKKSKKKSRRR